MADFNDSPTADSTRPFHEDYMGYDPRLPSQRFDSQRFEDSFNYGSEEKAEVEVEDGYGEVPSYQPPSFENGFNDETQDQAFHDEPVAHPDMSENFSQDVDEFGGGAEEEPAYGFSPAPPAFSSGDGGAVLPPLEEMEPEEGHLLREWKRKNAIHLQEKERLERERLEQIMDEADNFKVNFYKKRSNHCEAQKNNNRDKEKVFLSTQEHFHSTASKHYWKAVSELVPTELPAIETKRGKDKDKRKTTVIFNQGPKPGKATDMSRMRQVLLKLKHNPPPHMKTAPPPPPPKPETEDSKKNKAEPVIQSSAPPVEIPA